MPETQVPTQAAGLFQKAHGKIVVLQRLDSQLTALLSQRQRVHAELTGVQALINQEMQRVVHESNDLPTRILGEIVDGNEYANEQAQTVA